MKLEALRLYLVDGLRVSEIADKLEVSTAQVRGFLGELGLRVRGDNREEVGAAVRWRGYNSVHEFVQAKGVAVPLNEQAEILCINERVFSRVYATYRRLLEQLVDAGRSITEPGVGGRPDLGSNS